MQIAWTRAAHRDIEAIQDYVAQDSPRAAHQLAQDLVQRTARTLGEAPMAGRLGRARGTRELIFADLPYIVVYRVTVMVKCWRWCTPPGYGLTTLNSQCATRTPLTRKSFLCRRAGWGDWGDAEELPHDQSCPVARDAD
jgi:toxin ParE1/3/4